jgi:hypothetical protein
VLSGTSTELWSDSRITAGDDWRPDIQRAIDQASLAIMVISVDLLNSPFITDVEVPELLTRRASEDLRVVPVIARPCAWESVEWLSRIEARPKGKSLQELVGASREKALADIAREVGALLEIAPERQAGHTIELLARKEITSRTWVKVEEGTPASTMTFVEDGTFVEQLVEDPATRTWGRWQLDGAFVNARIDEAISRKHYSFNISKGQIGFRGLSLTNVISGPDIYRTFWLYQVGLS